MFDEDLDRLASIIKRSRNKKLKAAFELYLDSLTNNLHTYLTFLRFQNVFQNLGQPQQKEWTYHFKRKKTI